MFYTEEVTASGNTSYLLYEPLPSGTQLPFYYFETDPLRYIRQLEEVQKALNKVSITIDDFDELRELMEKVQGNRIGLHWIMSWTKNDFFKFKRTMQVLVFESSKRDYYHEMTVRIRHKASTRKMLSERRKAPLFYASINYSPGRSWMNGTPRKS